MKATFTDAIILFRRLSEVETTGLAVKGSVVLDDPTLISLRHLENEFVDPVVEMVGGESLLLSECDNHLGSKIKLTINFRTSPGGAFFPTINALLSHDQYKHSKPNLYYLADVNYLSSEMVDTCPKVSAYDQALAVVEMLRGISDHTINESNRLSFVFLQRERLELPVKYEGGDLRKLKELDVLEEMFLEESAHIGQKIILFKTVLLEMLRPVPVQDRFAYLLSNLSQCIDHFKNNYEVFVSEIDYQDLVEKIKDRSLKFVQQLNGTLTSIQNQLLTIPVALLIVGTQLNTGKDILANYGILLGSGVFSIFMILMIGNQFHSLLAIKNAVSAQSDKLKKELLGEIRFKEEFDLLNKRYIHQIGVLWFVLVVVIFGFGFSTYLYINATGIKPINPFVVFY